MLGTLVLGVQLLPNPTPLSQAMPVFISFRTTTYSFLSCHSFSTDFIPNLFQGLPSQIQMKKRQYLSLQTKHRLATGCNSFSGKSATATTATTTTTTPILPGNVYTCTFNTSGTVQQPTMFRVLTNVGNLTVNDIVYSLK